jgi:cytochrome P450
MSTDVRVPVRDFHVQAELHIEHDPFEAFLEYRESEPFWSEEFGGYWVFTRYEEVREIMQNPGLFSHARGGIPPIEVDEPLMPSFFDPPYQTKLRGVILPLMTASKIARLEPKMHGVCQDLIATFKNQGHCLMVAEFARKYPIAIFSDLFGLPIERREEFRALAETFLHDPEARASAWSSIREIIRDELDQRRSAPRDDMLGGVANGKIDGEIISDDVAVNLASTVFLGGLDTLPSNIGWAFRYLAEHPDQRQQLADDPSLAHAAAEEFLRVFPSVPRTNGTVTRDAHFHGVDLRAGDKVIGITTAANRDSAQFEDPMSVRFDRKINRHLSFSAGPHRCLGSHLARHELAVALQEWHAAIPSYRLPSNTDFKYHGGLVFALEELPLEWDVD